jgi:hypothetical protein
MFCLRTTFPYVLFDWYPCLVVIHLYVIYISLKIKPSSARIIFLSCQNFFLYVFYLKFYLLSIYVHLLLKCSFYYTSRRKLLETIKININHSNFEKLSFEDNFIWLLNSESKDILICMCAFLLKSHCFGELVSHILTLQLRLSFLYLQFI